jgi:outer membrane lipoprotein-sorting protein
MMELPNTRRTFGWLAPWRASRLALIGMAALLFAAASVHAQDPGPQAPPPTFKVERIPAEPHPGPPPLPVEEIIQKFAANEDMMKKAYDSYDFTQSIRLDELTDPGGKFSVTGEVYTKPDGLRYLRVTKPPESTLKLMHFSLEDVRVIASMPEFPLTAEEIENYTFKYAGQEKLDQLNTYIFQVKPKTLSRKKRYFEGVIWIDDHDFAIVKSYGKFVSELEGNGTALPFTMFETYRENFQSKYWLPTYTRSDDYFKSDGNEDLPLRLVVHSTDFKVRATAAGPSGAATAPPAADSTSSSSVPLSPPQR